MFLRFSFLLLLTLATLPAFGKSGELKLMKGLVLPNTGLKINIMADANEVPLPSPKVFTYTFSNVASNWTANMSSPYELWMNSQHAGTWTDNDGNTLRLAKITMPLPSGFNKEHVSKQDYDNAVSNIMTKMTGTWTVDALCDYAKASTHALSAVAEVVPHRPSSLKGLFSFKLAGKPRLLAYAFQMNKSSAGQSKAPDNWFLYAFEAGKETDLEAADKAILLSFSRITCSKVSEPDTPEASDRFQSDSRNMAKKKRSPQFIASRTQVANSIKNMRDWWYAETDNYIVLSNLKSKYRSMAKDLQSDVEELWPTFEKLVPPSHEIESVCVIRIFADADEYKAYVGPDYAWTGGLWTPDRKELVIKMMEGGSQNFNRQATLRVTYHEAFHQYLYHAIFPATPSAWFNEGHATLFEGATINNRGVSIKEAPELSRIVEDLCRRDCLNIPEILHMSYKEFYTGDQKTVSTHYALAWGIVYYLRKGAVLEKDSPWKNATEKYIKMLQETQDTEKATNIAIPQAQVPAFQKDFIRFWKQGRNRGTAERNNL